MEEARRLNKLKAWVIQHRVQVIVGSVVALALIGGGVAAYLLTRPQEEPIAQTEPVTVEPEPIKPTTKPSPLTGVEVAPELADLPIYSVIIENHPDARPQSGLSEAGVVYEALAEGGITRFQAFYLDKKPASLGPVRSLRTYFVSWALEFNAPVAHAGGNYDALVLINPLGLVSMNQFAYGGFYTRSRDRYAPHNLYTTADSMHRLLAQLNRAGPATFTPSPRKADAPANPAPKPTIGINYSYNGYQVEYRYDAASNDYLRFLAGAPHIDRNTGAQIRVKNVVVEFMPTAFGRSAIGEQNVKMGASGLPVGSNRALVFRDGTVVEGTWNKADHKTRTKLLDGAGAEIPLNAGNTWYSIVPVGRPVTY